MDRGGVLGQWPGLRLEGREKNYWGMFRGEGFEIRRLAYCCSDGEGGEREQGDSEKGDVLKEG